MCGITGIISLNSNPIEEKILKKFTNSLTHRGPDGYGIYLNSSKTIV